MDRRLLAAAVFAATIGATALPSPSVSTSVEQGPVTALLPPSSPSTSTPLRPWPAAVLQHRVDPVEVAEEAVPRQRVGVSRAAAIVDPLFPLSRTFQLSSRPDAPVTIYLDFDGATVTGTYWNDKYRGGRTIRARAYADPSDRASSFSDLERAQIQRIWAGVAAAYAPWDVDVTTATPPASDLARSSAADTRYGTHVVITPRDVLDPSCRCASGRAEMDLWSSTGVDNRYLSVAWVFSDYGWNVPDIIAALAAHEVGHNFGLSHDGVEKNGFRQEYYDGSAPWSPIMGSPFAQPLHQWSDGRYRGATEREDDRAMISRWAPPVPDDHVDRIGDLPIGSDGLPVADLSTGLLQRSARLDGLIGVSNRRDVDLVVLRVRQSGTYDLSVTPLGQGSALDVGLGVLDAAGRVLTAAAPRTRRLDNVRAEGTDASLRLSLRAGVYVLRVRGTGEGRPALGGEAAYGSIGSYRLQVVRTGL
ncbi:hypothetical protein GCM10022215_35920 [Nocardioides fonticola]|uniref:Peptidase C-terminal archaeal/bacterial domain-containing protein n=1 Tax=Nocardioides fonticola TaxID=450363 RepID=A0ABP7XUU2_9ACTN